MRQLFLIALLTVSMTVSLIAQTGNKQVATDSKSIEEMLIAYEKQSWEAVKRKDYKTFESFLADDFYDIFANGKGVTKSELLQNYIRGVNLIDYSLNDFKVIMLNNDAAIVVYTALAHGTESQAKSRKVKVSEIHAAVTSGWAKRNGKWLNVFYRESDIK
jgi:hypothetical protein